MESLTYIFLIVALVQCSNARKNSSQKIMNFGFGEMGNITQLQKVQNQQARKATKTQQNKDDGLFGDLPLPFYSITKQTGYIEAMVSNIGPMAPGLWQLFQHHRVDHTEIFKTTTWEGYESLFGSPGLSDPAFWMGLSNVHLLTRTGTWKLAVKVMYKGGGIGYAVWNNFKLKGVTDQYEMHLGKVIARNNVDSTYWNEVLTQSNADGWNGRRFSTTDKRTQGTTSSCVDGRGGGWWFYNCGYMCLNCQKGGIYSNNPIVETMMAIQKVDYFRDDSLLGNAGAGGPFYLINSIKGDIDATVDLQGAPNGSWILVQHHRVGHTKTFKTSLWVDYENVFGSTGTIDGAFWIGLNNLYKHTSSGTWKLAVKVKFQGGGLGYIVWNNFKVAGVTDLYRMHLGSVVDKANVNDTQWRALLNQKTTKYAWNGIEFSTPDKDNDNNSSINCAKLKSQGDGSGWWFDNCYAICLNCPQPEKKVTPIVETIMAIQQVK